MAMASHTTPKQAKISMGIALNQAWCWGGGVVGVRALNSKTLNTTP